MPEPGTCTSDKRSLPPNPKGQVEVKPWHVKPRRHETHANIFPAWPQPRMSKRQDFFEALLSEEAAEGASHSPGFRVAEVECRGLRQGLSEHLSFVFQVQDRLEHYRLY